MPEGNSADLELDISRSAWHSQTMRRVFLSFILWFTAQNIAAAAMAMNAPDASAQLPRLVSLNMCADPYLMAFADKRQILALTAFSTQAELSPFADAARAYPTGTGSIEDLLAQKPDLVITSAYSDANRLKLLAAADIEVLQLDAAQSYAQARGEIIRLGRAIGRLPQARAYLRRLDAAVKAHSRTPSATRRPRLVNFQRRGLSVGKGHIVDDIITLAGAENATRQTGEANQPLMVLSLEALPGLQADFLLTGAPVSIDAQPIDRGSDILSHPALRKFFPPEKRLVLPDNLVTCAGAATPLALARLRAALDAVSGKANPD
ncbi:MAG: ABC transporter substrate-binding protein [Parvibaculales bacterium]